MKFFFFELIRKMKTFFRDLGPHFRFLTLVCMYDESECVCVCLSVCVCLCVFVCAHLRWIWVGNTPRRDRRPAHLHIPSLNIPPLEVGSYTAASNTPPHVQIQRHTEWDTQTDRQTHTHLHTHILHRQTHNTHVETGQDALRETKTHPYTHSQTEKHPHTQILI